MLVDVSPELVFAHLSALRIFKGKPASDNVTDFAPPSQLPHVSLLYGEHSQEKRRMITTWVRETHPWADEGISFPVKELQLWQTSGGLSGVSSWSKLETYQLGDTRQSQEL